MILDAIRQLIAADSTITGMLAEYTYTTGQAAEPAIFDSRVPEDAECPFVFLAWVGGVPFGCRDSHGGDWRVDVTVYDDKDQASAKLRTLARLLW